MKISLEELTARSMDCGMYPRLVEIARVTKSPTAAVDLATKEKFSDFSVTSCLPLSGHDQARLWCGEVRGGC